MGGVDTTPATPEMADAAAPPETKAEESKADEAKAADEAKTAEPAAEAKEAPPPEGALFRWRESATEVVVTARTRRGLPDGAVELRAAPTSAGCRRACGWATATSSRAGRISTGSPPESPNPALRATSA